MNCQASAPMPNGVARSRPNRSVPSGDQSAIGTAKTSATRNRLRMSRAIATIDMPA